jgi:hypothetical protein
MTADIDPSNHYATIRKDGKTIATVYSEWFCGTPNGDALPNDLAADGEGLSLANRRIQQILKMYGGDVEYIQATRTQAASSRPQPHYLPPSRPVSSVARPDGGLARFEPRSHFNS